MALSREHTFAKVQQRLLINKIQYNIKLNTYVRSNHYSLRN